MVLDPSWRIPAVVHQVINIGTDILCLQEVEMGTFAALSHRLKSSGYAAQHARKRGKPDGCATFYREDVFELVATRVIEYADGGGKGQANSGHIALLVLLRAWDRVVGIANTHLSWDHPDTPTTAKLGRRQALQFLNEYQTVPPTCDGWLICGDLNATPDSDIVALLESTGFRYSHAGLTDVYTCTVNGEAKMIDYLFYSAAFRSEPQALLRISNRTVLPSSDQPSDHLPIVARFLWKP
jgi:endonuclease/exonuclease/phosphatase family metal-dependent hydrolase